MINKIFISLLLTALVLFAPQTAKAENTIEHEFDFVMAHKPDNEQNVALIKRFTENVFKRTNGAVKINPVNAIELYGPLNGRTLNRVRAKLYTGEIGMSQVSVKKFINYSPTVDALDMPMVFRDHDHVQKVLDGKIGKKIITDLYEGSDGQIQGLDFTYSGGFRNIYTTVRPVTSVADLKGMKIRARSNRTSRDAVHYLGLVQSIDLGINFVAAHARGDVLAEEAETLRLLTYAHTNPDLVKNIKTVLVTKHSVFLTLVAVNGPIFRQLSEEQQAIVREEVRTLALDERTLSIQQAIDGRKMFEAQGIQFIDASAEDKKLLQEMGDRVHKKYANQPVGEVIQAILETK